MSDLPIEIDDAGCWLWTGRIARTGYGNKGKALAHRYVYELLVGPIPAGLELDHLCRVPRCVNPEHLEPVTHAENVRRGMAGQTNKARLLARMECKHGHPFDGENVGVGRDGYRRCRECNRIAARKHYWVKKAAR